jgi:hypothetical protein
MPAVFNSFVIYYGKQTLAMPENPPEPPKNSREYSDIAI